MALGSIGVAVGQNSRNAEKQRKQNLRVALRALLVRYFTGSWFLHQVMHNRKKLDRAPTVEEIAAVQKKTRTYASLVSNVLERRRTQDNSAETLALIEKMLSSSPDFYTLYNFRREICMIRIHNWQSAGKAISILRKMQITSAKLRCC
jgi:hypothetical protein